MGKSPPPLELRTLLHRKPFQCSSLQLSKSCPQIWIFLELLFVYFFYVETRGPTLEELAKIFDGENAEVSHIDIQQVEKELNIDGNAAAIHDEKRGIQTQQTAV